MDGIDGGFALLPGRNCIEKARLMELMGVGPVSQISRGSSREKLGGSYSFRELLGK